MTSHSDKTKMARQGELPKMASRFEMTNMSTHLFEIAKDSQANLRYNLSGVGLTLKVFLLGMVTETIHTNNRIIDYRCGSSFHLPCSSGYWIERFSKVGGGPLLYKWHPPDANIINLLVIGVMLPQRDKDFILSKCTHIISEANQLSSISDEDLPDKELAVLMNDKLDAMLKAYAEIHDLVSRLKGGRDE